MRRTESERVAVLRRALRAVLKTFTSTDSSYDLDAERERLIGIIRDALDATDLRKSH